MKITNATLYQLEELAAMFDAYRIFYRRSSDLEGAKNFLRERIKKNESVIYLAVDEDEQLVGFAQLYPLFSSTRMKRLWLLNDLFVKAGYRGKGISKLLLEKCKALAMETNACEVLLETEKTNVIGNRLYPTVGFELYDETNFYSWQNVNQ